jgi:hypothetical protein
LWRARVASVAVEFCGQTGTSRRRLDEISMGRSCVCCEK